MKKIQNLLIKLSQLLINNNEKNWGNALLRLHKESFNYEGKNYDPYFIRRIMNIYGGMGSFNDLILHKNMKPLKKENDELDDLRNDLYEECANLRTKKQSSYSEENEYKENKEQEDEKE